MKNIRGIKIALALSGGIDSAILAKFMPKGTKAYTFKCVVPGIEVTDETKIASIYAEECGLKHKIIEIYWEGFEKYASLLMEHKKHQFIPLRYKYTKQHCKPRRMESILFFWRSS